MSRRSDTTPIDSSGTGVEGRRLWLVRHGESTWNAAGLVQGQLDPGLNEAGREQAVRCALFLSTQPRPEALFSSDLRRSLETAAAISSDMALGVRVDAALRERALGDAEGSASTLLGPDRSGVAAGRVVDADVAPKGGESVRQLYERVARCGTQLLSSHSGDVVLVCHGGVVRVLLAWLDGVAPDDMQWPEVGNGVPILRKVRCAVSCA